MAPWLLLASITSQTYLVPLDRYAPDIVQEMRYAGGDNFIGREVDGYEVGRCWLSEPAALALERAQRLANRYGMSLKVYDCYRPKQAVQHFVRWSEDRGDNDTQPRFYPQFDKKDLFQLGYIAERSSHTRGSAVDVTLVEVMPPTQIVSAFNADCRLPLAEVGPYPSLNMGSSYDCFDPRSHSEAAQVSAEARRNRLLLRLLMEQVGFEHYPEEWWHFTLKDEPYPNSEFDYVIDR
ncbi:M15 family metallopeptidase [Ferrimonas marina]|uniref:D-alanyl-D-alanine dipeptidase n=1 Tax=Ferrimonas marina TaxID=299255 RepID=A0A1M5QYU9_9GAMM|nr:M15 family metallopeptidase [Ferrimonas marina]SHH19036.1 D-alanyl-D-alanine dipeptidase [Ferrimonas marina]